MHPALFVPASVLGVLAASLHAPALAATAPPPTVAELIEQANLAHDRCQNGDPDEPETDEACERRDAFFDRIEALGWCFGHDPQAEAERVWEPCIRRGQEPEEP